MTSNLVPAHAWRGPEFQIVIVLETLMLLLSCRYGGKGWLLMKAILLAIW